MKEGLWKREKGGERTKKREKRAKRKGGGGEDGRGGRVHEIWWGRKKNDNPKFLHVIFILCTKQRPAAVSFSL